MTYEELEEQAKFNHRIIDEIATALGYRVGDTFEPEVLVDKVRHLLGDMYELQLRDEVQHKTIHTIAILFGYKADDVIDLTELTDKVKKLVEANRGISR